MADAFTKNDKEKAKLYLIEPEFIEGTGRVLTHGASTYSPDNWKRCPTPWASYYSALQRHLSAIAKGEVVDPDSGENHIYHVACCVMFIAWFEENGLLTDHPRRGADGTPTSTRLPVK